MTGFDPPLDEGIAQAVAILCEAGVETFESCEGGQGHSYPEPTVRFYGGRAQGLAALAVAMDAGLPVVELRRVWPVIESEPTGPWWELTFAEPIRRQGNEGGRDCARAQPEMIGQLASALQAFSGRAGE